MSNQTIAMWKIQSTKFLTGKTIVEVRYLTDQEMNDLGWYNKALVIFFSDGSYIFPSQDNEGNNAGALFTSDPVIPTIPAI